MFLAAGCDNGEIYIFSQKNKEKRREMQKSKNCSLDAQDRGQHKHPRTKNDNANTIAIDDSKVNSNSRNHRVFQTYHEIPQWVLKPQGAVTISVVLSTTSLCFSQDSKFLYAEYNGSGTWGGTMHHLACFAPVRRMWDLQVRHIFLCCYSFYKLNIYLF